MKFSKWLSKRRGFSTFIGDFADDIWDMKLSGELPDEIYNSDDHDVWFKFLTDKGANRHDMDAFGRAFFAASSGLRSG